jgi:hypothetical protein
MIGSTELILIELIIIKIIVWVLYIGLAYLLIKYLINRNKAHGVEGNSALDIAKEEFEEIKKNII